MAETGDVDIVFDGPPSSGQNEKKAIPAPNKPPIEITDEHIKEVETNDRNALEVTREALAEISPGAKSQRWGEGKTRMQKLREHLGIKKRGKNIEIVLAKAYALSGRQDTEWKKLTEQDLAELANLQSRKENIVALEPLEEILDLSAPLKQFSPAEQAERTRDLIALSNILRTTIQKMRREQLLAIDRLYPASKTIKTPILMERHRQQKHVGQEGIYTCFVSSALNALDALGVSTPQDNEESAIQAMRGPQAFEETGYLAIGEIVNFLENRGLSVRESGNIIELMQTLENGGVAIFVDVDHAKMISGAESTPDGQIALRIHDPIPRKNGKVEKIPVKDVLGKLVPIPNQYNLLLVENPQNLK